MGTLVDIAAWLSELGLERYAQVFRDSEIEPEVLAELTDEDFKELGIPLGPRRKLAKAIAAFSPEAATPSDHLAIVGSPATPPQAERRQLTVMFVDLVGSTALAARLDPEDMGAVIRAYQECCAEVVERWGGHVAKYMGDGVLAYFGWPRAHEDEAERAVRAGLALVDGARAAGDYCGRTVGGPGRDRDRAGHGRRADRRRRGARRSRGRRDAEPGGAIAGARGAGSVVISQATRRLLGGVFELDDLGPQRLKGFAEPLAAWRVEGEGGPKGASRRGRRQA